MRRTILAAGTAIEPRAGARDDIPQTAPASWFYLSIIWKSDFPWCLRASGIDRFVLKRWSWNAIDGHLRGGSGELTC
ncbi:MAG: hypothetical protein AB7K24_30505 [Gemmataceae bacterium]